jgi:7,8-dihydropterin-6-yl-methyl-4-(beta-D-ribofuranosyl)aminobenzene 5'-phosphate synthase
VSFGQYEELQMKRLCVGLLFSVLACTAVWGFFSGRADQIRVTILYDNYVYTEGTKSDWGFSCLIEGTAKTILFDTGTKGDILMHNMRKLKVDPQKVDLVVISHEHGDHTGGLPAFFEENSDVVVYHPVSFSEKFVNSVRKAGAESIAVDKPVKLCEGVYSTGEMRGGRIEEQSLVLETSQGLVVITGCSHQGIVNIVQKARSMFDKNIHIVFGGFHLLQHSDDAVDRIIAKFKEMGVAKCGATHCTGDRQIRLFEKAYGSNFVQMGVGRVLRFTK